MYLIRLILRNGILVKEYASNVVPIANDQVIVVPGTTGYNFIADYRIFDTTNDLPNQVTVVGHFLP